MNIFYKSGKTPDEDIAYQYLRYLELDDDKFDKIKNNFINGTLSPEGIKEILMEKIWGLMEMIQTNRKKK